MINVATISSSPKRRPPSALCICRGSATRVICPVMPLHEDRVKIKKDNLGDNYIACHQCHNAAEDAETVGDLPFLLQCLRCQVTLGEWATRAERRAVKDAFVRQQ